MECGCVMVMVQSQVCSGPMTSKVNEWYKNSHTHTHTQVFKRKSSKLALGFYTHAIVYYKHCGF